MTDALEDPIRRYQSEMRELGLRADRLRPVLKSCRDAIQRADMQNKSSIMVGKRRPGSPQVEILLTITSLDETIPLFRELAKEGLRTDKSQKPQDQSLFEIIAMREYPMGPDLTVLATIIAGTRSSETGKSCRMEKVGTKEVPIYQMKCD